MEKDTEKEELLKKLLQEIDQAMKLSSQDLLKSNELNDLEIKDKIIK